MNRQNKKSKTPISDITIAQEGYGHCPLQEFGPSIKKTKKGEGAHFACEKGDPC